MRAQRHGCTIPAPPGDVQDVSDVIDRLREQLQDRLDQVLSEADRLRKALAALDPRSPSVPARKIAGRVAPSRRRTRPATPGPNGAPAQTARGRRSAGSTPASGSKSPAARRTRSPRRRTRASTAAADTATTPSRRRRAATAGPSSAASAAGARAAPKTASHQPTGSTKRPRRPRAAASEPTAPLLPSDSAATGRGAPATSDTTPTSEPPAALSPRRRPAGETRGAVLAALAGGEPMTASQVSDRAGLSRATVSTILSRLAKAGEVQKAHRGYQLAPASPPAQPTDTPAAVAGGAAQPTAAADVAPSAAPPPTAADA